MPTRAQRKLDQLRRMTTSDPEDALLQFGFGTECFRARQYEEAIPALRLAIRLKPDYSAAYRELARSLSAMGRTKEAMHIFQEGIEVSQRMGDLQTAKEMKVFLRRLEA